MSKLIDELKRDHVILANTLQRVQDLGRVTPEGQAELLAAKATLLAHLKVEDERLYPVLEREASKNESFQRTLNAFASDMKEISQAAIAFFDRYTRGGSGMDFAKDIGKLLGTLTSRIRREENILYPKYEEVCR